MADTMDSMADTMQHKIDGGEGVLMTGRTIWVHVEVKLEARAFGGIKAPCPSLHCGRGRGGERCRLMVLQEYGAQVRREIADDFFARAF
jgi:hypothetical protein